MCKKLNKRNLVSKYEEASVIHLDLKSFVATIEYRSFFHYVPLILTTGYMLVLCLGDLTRELTLNSKLNMEPFLITFLIFVSVLKKHCSKHLDI